MRFVILMHPNERRRPIASGRMAHLALMDSLLVEGVDFTEHAQINGLLRDASYHPIVLYPTPLARNLSVLGTDPHHAWVPDGKRLLVFVIDGTWSKAKKMMRLSANLQALPQVCFSPRRPSGFVVRKQPHPNCLSSLEAIHEFIELLAPEAYLRKRPHDNLLDVFHAMVQAQIRSEELGRWSGEDP